MFTLSLLASNWFLMHIFIYFSSLLFHMILQWGREKHHRPCGLQCVQATFLFLTDCCKFYLMAPDEELIRLLNKSFTGSQELYISSICFFLFLFMFLYMINLPICFTFGQIFPRSLYPLLLRMVVKDILFIYFLVFSDNVWFSHGANFLSRPASCSNEKVSTIVSSKFEGLGDILVVCLKRKSSAACIPHLRTLSLRADVAMRRGIATSAKNKIK